MQLSVVVVNWNSREDLARCLASLREQTVPVQVVVVDNGSTDGSPELVREEFPEAILVANPTNLGFAEGCNRGIEVTSSAWVALLNNDAIAHKSWAEAVLRATEEVAESCGMLQSLMLFMHDSNLVNSTGIELMKDGGGVDRHEHRTRDTTDTGLTEVFCPTGGAAIYRRSMLDALETPNGYLDRYYFCYYEDLDLGWRARLAGWSAYHVPTAVVVHRYQGSSARRGRAWRTMMAESNRLGTLLKNASAPFLLRCTPRALQASVSVLWHGGREGPSRLARSVCNGLEQRKLASQLCTLDRRTLEARWVRAKRS